MSDGSRVAIVTGGSRGIGQALVAALLDRGYRTVTCSRTGGVVERRDLLALTGDVSDFASGLVEAAVARFGRVDTLVNNAGASLPHPFTDYSRGEFAQVLAVTWVDSST